MFKNFSELFNHLLDISHIVSEISYDEFVELQAKVGTKYYFPGLADELEKYE